MAESAPTLRLFTGWSFPDTSLISLYQDILPVREGGAGGGTRVAMGWSLGGLRALREMRAGTATFTHLVLLSTSACFCGDEAGWPGLSPAALRALQRQLTRDPAAALAGFHRLCAAPPLSDDVLAARVAASLRLGLPALAEGLRELGELDLRAELEHVTIPVLLLHGEHDQVIPVAAAEQTASRLPQARLVVHPEAGHDLPLAHPAWVAEHVKDFLHPRP